MTHLKIQVLLISTCQILLHRLNLDICFGECICNLCEEMPTLLSSIFWLQVRHESGKIHLLNMLLQKLNETNWSALKVWCQMVLFQTILPAIDQVDILHQWKSSLLWSLVLINLGNSLPTCWLVLRCLEYDDDDDPRMIH